MPGRIVEAYVGEYASGKSENAVNRALSLKQSGRQVALVDLDLVEPFYTLRPVKRLLIEKGLDVVAWETSQTMGLGEAGSVLHPAMKWVLRRPGDIILDVGYGSKGTSVLNLVEGANEDPDLRIIAVINVCRPMTSTVSDIVDYIRQLGRIDALLNNTNLGDDTTIPVILEGEQIVQEAAALLHLPVVATSVAAIFQGKIEDQLSSQIPIRYLSRFMPQSFW
ncbi:hypothetical protein [Candidatus Formimonas warabiya]|uniref:MinD/ParA family protein n=1 Tax=Formimonas warabiya TaxID=1761012 RepID=A0A3G1KVK9_FORW1|nr:hypothetical protein [Candidatus Formimonas warabiya]ATW26450.1 hypothetical protein DCMF_18350 [Candidatus Formimonas warabiya]